MPGQKFIIDTDDSDKLVGAVLSSTENDLAYYSKALNKHEQSYCITREELFAVVSALKHFHPPLYGQEILLRTDNAGVHWMSNLKTLQGRLPDGYKAWHL